MSANDRIIAKNWYILYTQHFIVGKSLYKTFLSLILKGIPNSLPKIVFVISAEYASRYGKIESIIILDVDVVLLIYKVYGLISAMTCASFTDEFRSPFASYPPCV